MISFDTIVAKCDDIFWRNYDGEVLIVREETSDVYMLNGVASHIWESVDGQATVEHIISSVCEQFEVEREVATKDVSEFLMDLIGKNLLKIV